jgi:hypothetical protein
VEIAAAESGEMIRQMGDTEERDDRGRATVREGGRRWPRRIYAGRRAALVDAVDRCLRGVLALSTTEAGLQVPARLLVPLGTPVASCRTTAWSWALRRLTNAKSAVASSACHKPSIDFVLVNERATATCAGGRVRC